MIQGTLGRIDKALGKPIMKFRYQVSTWYLVPEPLKPMTIFREISATVQDIPVHIEDWMYFRREDLTEVSAKLLNKLPPSLVYCFPDAVIYRSCELLRQEARELGEEI